MIFQKWYDSIKWRDIMENENRKSESLASEMYEDLKKATKFREKMIYILVAIIVALVAALAGTNLYHIHQWSMFDTVVVDSGDGEGNANYVQGDNTGGIYNGQSDSTQTQEGQEQGR